MRRLAWRTVRIRRGWLDRLRGFDRLYETKITDGERVTYGRGPTREASEQSARTNWEAQFSQPGLSNDFPTNATAREIRPRLAGLERVQLADAPDRSRSAGRDGGGCIRAVDFL